jgi:hypothetical protein
VKLKACTELVLLSNYSYNLQPDDLRDKSLPQAAVQQVITVLIRVCINFTIAPWCPAGAKVVEANYSCPNVGKGQGALYLDAQQVASLTAALVQVRARPVAWRCKEDVALLA